MGRRGTWNVAPVGVVVVLVTVAAAATAAVVRRRARRAGGQRRAAARAIPGPTRASDAGTATAATSPARPFRPVPPARTRPVLASFTTVDRWAGTKRSAAHAGDGGPAGEAALFHPSGLDFDDDGNAYVVDSNNEALRRIDPDGTITTIAGGNGRGYSGDGGPATEAQFHLPTDVVVDADGVLYVADRDNHAIRRIDPDGTITTIAGGNGRGYTGDGGPAVDARIRRPRALALATDGTLYFSDRQNCAARRVDPDGTIGTVLGGNGVGDSGDGGPATAARIANPRGIAILLDGSLLVADYLSNRIRRVDHEGTVTTFAGGNGPGRAGDGGPATRAQLHKPSGIVVAADGTVLVTEHENHGLRRIDPDGTISTIAGGNGRGHGGDGGPPLEARFNWPSGLAIGPDGALYVADRNSDLIRRLS